MGTFIIENDKEQYISNILMALFYFKTHIEKILSNSMKDGKIVYMQEYIKNYFIDSVRANRSITYSILKNIIELFGDNNWPQCHYGNETSKLSSFYDFLMILFGVEPLRIIQNVDRNIHNVYAIQLEIPSISAPATSVNILDLINNMKCHMLNTPSFVCLSINRFIESNMNKLEVIIPKKIKLTTIDFLDKNKWYFHSAICYDFDKKNYFTLLHENNTWLIYNCNNIPCLMEVKMDDICVTQLIKTSSLLILYKSNKFY